MRKRIGLAFVLCFCLAAWAGVATAQDLRIGVVDLGRLINSSPQAERAKSSMAKQFAKRKDELEAKTGSLRQDIERLKRDGSVMSDKERDELQGSIRDRQRELQMRQSKYNDDVGEAEKKEFERMRGDIRKVIDEYAKEKGFDLILGDAVLYATDEIDVTDEILARLKQR